MSQFIWTGADIIGHIELVAEEGESERPQQPGIIDYFDILCPVLETLLLLPGRDDELIWNGLPTDVNLKWAIAPSSSRSSSTESQASEPAPSTPSKPPRPDHLRARHWSALSLQDVPRQICVLNASIRSWATRSSGR